MRSSTKVVIPEKCIGFKEDPIETTMSYMDAILYHIAVGYGQDPMNENDLPYVYEGDSNFKVFPSNWTVVRGFEIFGLIMACPGMPFFDALKLLHGESSLTVLKEIYVGVKYYNVGIITDVADKGSGCLLTMDINTHEQGTDDEGNPVEGKLGDLCVVNTCSLFIRGLGGFGFKGKLSSPPLIVPPIKAFDE